MTREGAARPQPAADRSRGPRGAGAAICAAAAPTTASSAPCCAPPTRWGGPEHERSRHLTRRDFAAGARRPRARLLARPEASLAGSSRREASRQPAGNRMLDAWIRIDADGSATVFTGKVELGQGILTALAQIAAEELDLPLARVTHDLRRHGRTPNEGHTAGSQSIENSGTALRLAGAEVRAHPDRCWRPKKLGVAADDAHGRGRHDQCARRPQGRPMASSPPRSTSSATRPPKSQPKPPAEHESSAPSVHAPRHPGQGDGRRRLRAGHAAARHAARPRGASAALWRRARQLRRGRRRGDAGRGRVVRDGSFLGVVAEREEQAIKARAALPRRQVDARPDAARSSAIYEQLMSLPSEDTVISEQAGAAARRPAPRRSRRPTRGPTRRTARSGRPARSPSSRTAS